MQEMFEKIIERLRLSEYNHAICGKDMAIDTETAVQIVEDAYNEYNNGWIPCSERLPDEAFPCLVTVIDTEPMAMEDFNNILPYFVGYDGETWNDEDGEVIPFEVIAWQPLPSVWKGVIQ